MSLSTVSERFTRPRRETLAVGAVVCNTELLFVLAYLFVSDATITNPLYLLLPFVWTNVALWAVWRTDLDWSASRRHRWLAAAVGVGYFLVLAWVGGVIGYMPGIADGASASVSWGLAPGWGPVVNASLWGLMVTAFPYKVVGYAALAYLVAATVLDAAGSVVSGFVGLFSCVSCTWPVLGTVLTGVFGGSSAVVAFATGQPYGASTIVFLSAVALLRWRPRWS